MAVTNLKHAGSLREGSPQCLCSIGRFSNCIVVRSEDRWSRVVALVWMPPGFIVRLSFVHLFKQNRCFIHPKLMANLEIISRQQERKLGPMKFGDNICMDCCSDLTLYIYLRDTESKVSNLIYAPWMKGLLTPGSRLLKQLATLRLWPSNSILAGPD